VSGISDDELADLDDEQLEALVEAEYRDSHERAIRASRAWGAAVFASPRESIRKDLKRRQREARADKIERYRLAEAKRRYEDAERQQERAEPPPALPLGLTWYAHGTLQQAVRLLAKDVSRNDVAKTTKLSPKDATRAHNLQSGDLLRLNEQRKLIVSPRVARKRGRIALRYLDGRSERWLDPHTDPP
jgi:hypothetical protein